MLMAHLSQTPPIMSSIGDVCNSLGKTFLTSLVSYHRATGGLRVNSSSVKGGLINFHLFLLEGNEILPMTPKGGCEGNVVQCREIHCSAVKGSTMLRNSMPFNSV